MCVIVDPNTIPLVFNTKSAAHPRFATLYSWIHNGDGKIVYGGKKYAIELKRMTSFMRLFQEYERLGKVVRADDSLVDSFAAQAKARVKSKHFNDEHLLGIVTASHCRIICTDEKEAIPYLTDPKLYKSPAKPPKIYNRASHGHMCIKKNLAVACRD